MEMDGAWPDASDELYVHKIQFGTNLELAAETPR